MVRQQAIIDLDGTLSDNRHRHDLIQQEEKKWREYLIRCKEDSLVQKMFDKIEELSENYEIVILTMRSDEVKSETINWLEKHGVEYDRLIMLPEGRWDIKDCEFKYERLKELDSPVMAFDDKETNCRMFLDEGLKVFKVGSLPDPDFEKLH